jgi:hypothetical protein
MKTFEEAIEMWKTDTPEKAAKALEAITGRYADLIEQASKNRNTKRHLEMILIMTAEMDEVDQIIRRDADLLKFAHDLAISAFISGVITGIEMEKSELPTHYVVIPPPQ